MPYRPDQIVTGGAPSLLHEKEYSSNKGDVRLGERVDIKMNFGKDERTLNKIKSYIIEYYVGLKPTVDPATEVLWTTLFSVWDDHKLEMNKTEVAKSNQSDGRSQLQYYQTLSRRNPDVDSFLATVGEDMEDHFGAWNPYVDGTACQSRLLVGSDSVATSTGYLQRHRLEHFFPEILEHNTLHRISDLDLYFKLTKSDLASRLRINPAGADIGNESQLLVFKDFKIRVVYEKFDSPIPDPFPTGQPMIVASKRRELKRVVGAFDNAKKEYTINLKTMFSAIEMIRELDFWVEPSAPTFPNGTDAGQRVQHGARFFKSIRLTQNSEDVLVLDTPQEIMSYWNKTLRYETGHGYYHNNQVNNFTSTPVTLLTNYAFVPFLSLADIHESTLSHQQHSKVLILDGINNNDNTYQVILTAQDQGIAFSGQNWATLELFVEAVSWAVGKVSSTGQVKVVGL